MVLRKAFQGADIWAVRALKGVNMKILFVTSECAPFSKSGGLADVMFSLPPALKSMGHETAVISPLYRCVREKYGESLQYVKNITVQLGYRNIPCGLWKGERANVVHWFVENDGFFDRHPLYGYGDDSLRFAFFSRAVIDLIPHLDFRPEILHCNDWESALAVIYLKNDQAFNEDLKDIKSVYTIHNMAYQGQFGASEITDIYGLPWGWYDGGLGYEFEGRHDVNLMKGAMLMADAVSTVSPTYARELHTPEFGHGLDGVIYQVDSKLYGILNGIDMDHYDPTKDPRIPANFSAEDQRGKDICKASIQKKFGLDPEPEWPLIASVARLNEQKGIELVKQVLPGLMDMGVQLIVFGQGEQHYIDYFNDMVKKYPGQLGFSSDYTEQMASEIFAGADLYLMPSRFEPCGLSQMMAMRYGTLPIVRETGGLKDSVRPYSDFDGIGDGFSFREYSANSLYLAILEAVKLYFCDEPTFRTLRRRCMTKDFSWTKSAAAYEHMYGEISGGSGDGEPISFEDAFALIKDAYEKVDEENRMQHPDDIDPNFRRIIQIRIVGRGQGTLHLDFSNGKIHVIPTDFQGADSSIECSLDNLLGIVDGRVSIGKLYMSGNMKITGNVSKSFELRELLVSGTSGWRKMANRAHLND